MRPIGIIIVAVSLGAIVAILGGNYSDQNETKPWVGLNCDKMLDFSASDQHQDLTMDQHMKFHEYYVNHCSDTEIP